MPEPSDPIVLEALRDLPDGVVILDQEWVYRFVNPAAARLLGTTVGALLGRSYYELYPDAVGTPFEQAYARVMSSGAAETVEDYYEPWDRYFRNRIVKTAAGLTIFFSDVTRERRRERSLELDLSLLQQALDFAPVGIVLHDLSGRYRLVNRFAADRTGQPAESMLGRQAVDFVPAALAARWAATESRVRSRGLPEQARLTLRTADGRPAHYESTVFPTYDATGQLSGTGAIFSDVTERQHAQSRATATEQLYRDLFDQARLGQLVARPDGTLLDANSALCTMLGYTRAELLSLPLRALAADEPDAEPAPSGDYEGHWRRRDGTLVPVAVTVTAMAGRAGEEPLLTSIVRDLTEVQRLAADKDRALSALRDAHASLIRFQALVETSEDFIAIADLSGRVVYVNPAGRALVQLEDGLDITQTVIADYLTPDGQVASLEVERPAVLAHGRWRGESTLRNRRDGSAIPVGITSFLMHHPDTGEPFAFATVQRDITERVAAEQRLHEADLQRHALLTRLVEAQELERAGIAADVHDDSVQALAAVDLRLGVLRRRLAAEDSPWLELVDQLQHTVSTATERLRRLLFDLESPPQELPLAEALRDAAAHLFESGTPSFRLLGDLAADLPYAERIKAVRIAKEAMSNAVQHAVADRVVVHLSAVHGGVEIAVTDDGCGLDPEQASSPPGHRGLATMRDRAALAGGAWALERAEPRGTTVRFWLPGSVASG